MTDPTQPELLEAANAAYYPNSAEHFGLTPLLDQNNQPVMMQVGGMVGYAFEDVNGNIIISYQGTFPGGGHLEHFPIR